ncbi:hypothetical protein COU77_03710 [Candidatus Peregrinibacteria bacterium CG10_big_fil_rev_8_21_14_0_10_49_16]|nr:MAG: hypothetical protein COW95_03120 [Candidatus Peregrinibacteria bacterium CG22_combo_CG10-13_8_21_14_all_49_11]PIR51813.1 MAG: hypothetical protein COU77_03710 [Candidatus Peregrinibacteria bacterium CG10_big_fil_rev_8_21_14_0_10_49_16]
MKHLVLVDGHHLMYRAYWAIPRTLKTNDGRQVNAVFGFASMILSLLKQEEPDALLICFDAGEETFRHQEHAEYKEGRAETPDDFYEQIPLILECVEACSFLHVSNEQYEADDLIASYAHAATAAGMRVSIVSGDRDLLQLADEHVRIIVPHKGYNQAEYIGPKEVEEKFGITPLQVPAWKGLVGDASDNLPGVMGIGPKTASRLLQQYHSLEGIYKHLDVVRPKEREKLLSGKEQAFFCERMAQLVCTIPLPHPLDSLILRNLSAEKVVQFFRSCGFTLLLKRFRDVLESPYGQKIFKGVPAEWDCGPHEQMTLFSS